MQISQEEFTKFTLDRKIKVLYTEGSFCMDIRYYGYKINLYLLHNFFVEVFYNHKADKIEKIEVMDKDNSRLKFYADRIRLPQL